MQLTAEHESLRTTTRRFVEQEITPHIQEWEDAGGFPAHELFPKLGALGLLGICKPEAFGGMGLDYSYNVVVAEELGRAGCGGVPLAIGVQTDMATPALARFGSDELRNRYLVPAIRGEMIASIAVSEPGAGSDVAAISTKAIADGNDYIIQGSKMWITNATQADYFCVLANTSAAKPHFNKSLIIVPSSAPGVSLSPRLNKLGMRSSDTAQIFFDDVRVPQSNRIGAEGMGFMMQMLQFQEERLWGAANALGGMQTSLDLTIDYCRQRHTFGQPLINNQVVHFRLAELQTEVELLRALIYQATEAHIRGEDISRLASMAKYKAGKLMRELTDSCLQYWGGMGYMWDNPVSRAFRDGRLVSIGGGADEIMLGIICKLMDILPRRSKNGVSAG